MENPRKGPFVVAQVSKSLLLSDRGVTLRQIASALGVSVLAVSIQLAGKRTAHPGLVPMIRCLAGVSIAAQIEDRIGSGGL